MGTPRPPSPLLQAAGASDGLVCWGSKRLRSGTGGRQAAAEPPAPVPGMGRDEVAEPSWATAGEPSTGSAVDPVAFSPHPAAERSTATAAAPSTRLDPAALTPPDSATQPCTEPKSKEKHPASAGVPALAPAAQGESVAAPDRGSRRRPMSATPSAACAAMSAAAAVRAAARGRGRLSASDAAAGSCGRGGVAATPAARAAAGRGAAAVAGSRAAGASCRGGGTRAVRPSAAADVIDLLDSD